MRRRCASARVRATTIAKLDLGGVTLAFEQCGGGYVSKPTTHGADELAAAHAAACGVRARSDEQQRAYAALALNPIGALARADGSAAIVDIRSVTHARTR